MKYLLSATLAAMVALGAGGALANVAMGTVSAVNDANHTVALENGQLYFFPGTVHLEAIHRGENATIGYTMMDGRREATSIRVQYDH